jgi:superfamily II DNA or RNA helicase
LLRPFQSLGTLRVIDEHTRVRSTLLVHFTGAGKTHTAAALVQHYYPKRTLFINNRKELVYQSAAKLQSLTGLHCDIEMGEHRSSPLSAAPIVVASIQTLSTGGDGGGRMAKFDPSQFGLVICDEAHRSVAATWMRVLDYFKTNPDLKIVGLTATPRRHDSVALGQLFESVAHKYDIINGLEDGWLVPIHQQLVTIEGLDYSAIRTTAGDLNGAEMGAVMEHEKPLYGVISASLDNLQGRRALAFCVTVRHAELMAMMFNRHRPGMAACVHAKTPDNERKVIFREFSQGKIQVLCNVGITTEGWDDPAEDLRGVQVLIMARLTKSLLLYTQMLGRGVRTLSGTLDGCSSSDERIAAIAASAKPFCHVIDFCGNAGQHKIVRAVDVLGGKMEAETVRRVTKRGEQAGQAFDVAALLEEEQERIRQEREAKRLLDESRRAKLLVKAKWTAQTISPFDELDRRPIAKASDMGKSLSTGERDMLLRHRINPDGMVPAEAKAMLREIMRRSRRGLASLGQAKWLKRNGYAEDMSRKEASRIMDAWKANNWQRPAGV